MSAEHERALRLLGAGYSPNPLTDEQLAAYLVAVDDLEPDLVHLAVVDLIRQPSRFMPRPGEVRQAVLRLLTPEVPDPGEAWSAVVAEVSRVGRYGRPHLDPLIAKAVEGLGGWHFICDSTNATADRARFLEQYARLVERQEREILASPALGGVLARIGAARELEP